MGSISAGSAALPVATVPTASSLSQNSVNGLVSAGVPDAAIGLANDIVGGINTAQNGGFTPAPTQQQSPTTTYQPTDATLNQPDPQYPGLIQAHAAVFRAMGTPAAVIQAISDSNPNAGTIEQYIQNEIFANPEGWDAYVQNPTGTARQGLLQLGIQLGTTSSGTAGPVQTGTGVGTTVGTPTVVQPSVEQIQSNAQNDIIKNLVWAAAGIGAAVIGYKLFKGHSAKAAQQVVEGGVQAATDGVRYMGGGGMMTDSLAGVASMAGSGMGSPGIGYQMMHGLGPGGTENMARAGFFSMNFNHPLAASLDHSLAEMALQTGQMRDLALYKHGAALAGVLGTEATQAASPLAKLLEGDNLGKLSKLAELL